jgi:hypothetical protein
MPVQISCLYAGFDDRVVYVFPYSNINLPRRHEDGKQHEVFPFVQLFLFVV